MNRDDTLSPSHYFHEYHHHLNDTRCWDSKQLAVLISCHALTTSTSIILCSENTQTNCFLWQLVLQFQSLAEMLFIFVCGWHLIFCHVSVFTKYWQLSKEPSFYLIKHPGRAPGWNLCPRLVTVPKPLIKQVCLTLRWSSVVFALCLLIEKNSL